MSAGDSAPDLKQTLPLLSHSTADKELHSVQRTNQSNHGDRMNEHLQPKPLNAEPEPWKSTAMTNDHGL
ncbi:hypothetical protein AAFF_G00298240 [Aldrovandia affinis]|uniref:Uncharacterized protein n=1 Tax=Aldrovandia affinis TaxID=143900 RepID=A0AAD7RBA3_9TELE|nr:hypothetical protein AAFF_G00298240 [Aldrovandia affinis]